MLLGAPYNSHNKCFSTQYWHSAFSNGSNQWRPRGMNRISMYSTLTWACNGQHCEHFGQQLAAYTFLRYAQENLSKSTELCDLWLYQRFPNCVTETRPATIQQSNAIWLSNNIPQLYAALPEELLHYSMEQSPSWDANQFSASQQIPRISWNRKITYRIHK